MLLAEIGLWWLRLVLLAGCVVLLADKGTRSALWGLAESSWQLFGVLLLGWVWRVNERTPIEKAIRDALPRLIRSGFDGAALAFYTKYSKRHIEFRKHIRSAGEVGIELRMPFEDPTRAWFQDVQRHCDENGLRVRVEGGDSSASHKIVCVEFGKDVEAAARLAQVIWRKAFSLTNDAPHRLKQKGEISHWGELVDQPDQKWLTWEKRWGLLHPEDEDPKPPRAFSAAVWVLFQYTVLVGLFVTAFNSPSQPDNWTIHLSGFLLVGSFGSLVFFCLFIFEMVVKRSVDRWINPGKYKYVGPRFGWSWKLFRRIAGVTVPIAVLLVWTRI